MKLIVSCQRAASYAQDDADYQLMLALLKQRMAYPRAYTGVRDAVAIYRHENAYKFIRIGD